MNSRARIFTRIISDTIATAPKRWLASDERSRRRDADGCGRGVRTTKGWPAERADRAPRKVANDSGAFTLIEIMIAITIFATVMMGMMAVWKCIINGTQVAQAAAAAAQRARISMKTIEDALVNTEVSKANIQYYAFVADTSHENFASLSLAARLPATFLCSGYFGDNVMRRVTFDIEKDAQDRNDLVMTQAPILAITSPEYPPKSITLAKDVTFFGLEFWSPTDSEFKTEFLPTNEIPPMVRVTLGIGHVANDPSVPLEVISRVVAMPVQAH